MKKTIKTSRCFNDSIVFYSNSKPYLGVKSYLNDEGEINTNVIFTTLLSNPIITTSSEELAVFIFDMAIILKCLFLEDTILLFAAIYFSLGMSLDLYYVVKSSLKFKFGSEKSAAKFHAAEHMAVNAYQTLQRVPSLEEIKHFSRFIKTCGSASLFGNIILWLLVISNIIFVFPNNFALFLLILIASIVFKHFAVKNGWLNFLQVFVTSKPSNAELSVAIQGLKKFEKLEDFLENNNQDFWSIVLKNLDDYFHVE